jgi:hypothetical protein
MHSRRWTAALALTAASAATLLLAFPAQAAPAAGKVALCSKGSFGSGLTWPKYGATSLVVQPGSCATFTDPGGPSVQQVNVLTGKNAYIGSFQLDGSRGVTVTTVSTASGPSFYIA